ncbi:HNH endonuclease family protein [Streptomyces sp. NPDC005438]|uniref:HNH endonuclease family protein n=1 Tax=Streptomyces sp. NPDC005438 TaxID=3156880 RepID=UPI0033B5F506
MRAGRWWRYGAASLAVLVVAGCGPLDGEGTAADEGRPSSGSSDEPEGKGGSGDDGLPGMPTEKEARDRLAGLKVAAHGSMDGYSREKFPHWSSHGENCDTREKVLQRAGEDVRRDQQCRAVSGRWTSVYDGEKVTDASELDIDHMVPLAAAWRSGAARWTQERREEFANDLRRPQLLAVTATTNRTKGDQGPEEWQPPAKEYWCSYARAWTAVKSTYRLTVTAGEKDRLGGMLDTCR